MEKWQPIPEGTRVKHRSKSYEGWIDFDPLTKWHNEKEVNPDGKTVYRIRISGHETRKLAAHHELQPCADTEKIFSSTIGLVAKTIEKQSHDKKEYDRLKAWNEIAPLPCTFWALNSYDPSNGGDPIKFLKDAARSEEIASAVTSFFPRLDNILVAGIPIAIVPSHKAGERTAALLELAQKLAEHSRIDATSCLVRHRTIESSRSRRQRRISGNEITCHLNSIRVTDSALFFGQVILLLDDVITTGATFMACRRLLLHAGAAETICLALGITKPRKSLHK